jgi:serine/threonine protein kinase
MSLDAERIQAVFRTALDAADPVQQAAILDRECGADTDMRQRVEALLKAHQESAPILGQASSTASEDAPSASDLTVRLDSSIDPEKPTVAAPKEDPALSHNEAKDDEGQPTLEFLQPSTKPGSLGQLGHYEVLEVLGRGGFGIVVRAFDDQLQRVVAIKVMSSQLATTSPARKRFLREARASARVRHENVVQIHAVEEQSLPYLVMEFIPGQTLQDRLDQTGPLEVSDVLRIGAQIARGLAAAHEQGLVHRDIKPANILLESGIGQKVKITDFGLARAADDASLSQSGVVAGTPLYMSPEQANGEPPDPRADLFSFGSVLYTMASGRPPFRAATTLAVLKRVADDTPRPIRQIIPEVPQWLCDIISTLHAKAPAQRYQSAAEVAALLERHLACLQEPSVEAKPEIVESPRHGKSRRMSVLIAMAAVLAVVGAVLTYPMWRPVGPTSAAPAKEGTDNAGEQAQMPAAALRESAATEPVRSHVLQGQGTVRTALIDFDQPQRRFGGEARDNAVRRAVRCNAFLVRFDLAKLGLTPKARIAKAMVSFYVWDPSSAGRTKVCAFPLKTAWDSETVTWREPATGKAWKGGEGFAFEADTGPGGAAVIVEPEKPGTDTVDPPIEYQLDVTDLVRLWLNGDAPNFGLAIAPVIDPGVDEDFFSRFQVYGSEHSTAGYTPKLTVQVRQ